VAIIFFPFQGTPNFQCIDIMFCFSDSNVTVASLNIFVHETGNMEVEAMEGKKVRFFFYVFGA